MIHLLRREASAICYYRSNKHYSMNQIAMILDGRSTRTVQRIILKNKWVYKLYDNRHLPRNVKIIASRIFRKKLRMLQWCLTMFLMGMVNDISVLSGDKPP